MGEVKQVKLLESDVMGRSAVLNLAGWMLVPAMVQLVTGDGSHVIDRYGGMRLSAGWALCLLFGALLIWQARAEHARGETVRAARAEIAGAVLLILAIGGYVVALVASSGLDGAIFVACICGSTTTNLVGRSALQARRLGWTRRARRSGP